MNQTEVAVIGLWHLGCTVSACLADKGYSVTGIDFDKKIMRGLKSNTPPLFEPGLEDLIKKNNAEGRLNFTSDFKSALENKKFIVIAFDTPVNSHDEPDMAVIYKAMEKIAEFGSDDCIIIIMSQVPVGSCRLLKKFNLEKKPGFKCALVYNPENIMLGQAIKKFSEADRVILGLEDPAIQGAVEDFYKVIDSPKLYMDLESAEMVKHATNSFLAMSISFINEIADMCEVTGADVRRVSAGLKADKRIGAQAFLSPGMGYAGGTLGRDVAILRNLGKERGVKTRIVNAVREVNKSRQQKIVEKLQNSLGGLTNKKIVILGLTYKPGTSTLRRSMSVELAKKLLQSGATVSAFDPKVSTPLKNLAAVKITADVYDAIAGAEAILLATDWPEFKTLDFAKIKNIAPQAIVVDCKNFLVPEEIKKNGLKYYGIGFNVK